MNLQKFTVKAQEAVQRAAEIAQSRTHQGLDPAHLASAFLTDEGGLARTLIQRVGADPAVLGGRVDPLLDALP
ncbi:MAG TPA: Clp protease N-terminal domain-containing protein, partial [Rubricoccaceae bacterium]